VIPPAVFYACVGVIDAKKGVHPLVNDSEGFGAPKVLLQRRYPASHTADRYAKSQDKKGYHHKHQDDFHAARRFGTRFTTRGRGSKAGKMRFYVDRIYGGEVTSMAAEAGRVCNNELCYPLPVSR
jgi:hypothetical protein